MPKPPPPFEPLCCHRHRRHRHVDCPTTAATAVYTVTAAAAVWTVLLPLPPQPPPFGLPPSPPPTSRGLPATTAVLDVLLLLPRVDRADRRLDRAAVAAIAVTTVRLDSAAVNTTAVNIAVWTVLLLPQLRSP